MIHLASSGGSPDTPAYYVGHEPRPGPVPPTAYPLETLAPSAELRLGLAAVRALLAALADGSLKGRDRLAIKAWSQGDSARGMLLRRALAFLQGARLEAGETLFRERYRRELQADAAWGALAWLKCLDAGEGPVDLYEELPGQWPELQARLRELTVS